MISRSVDVRIFILLVLCTGAMCAPTINYNDDFNSLDPEEAGHIEGDMLLSGEQIDVLTNPIGARNGLLDPSTRWPDRTVYYKISEDFSPVHRNAILAAIATLQSTTCVKFREANESSEFYVMISAVPDGCYSAVGYQSSVQVMNLQMYPIGEGCFRPGTILHELMHVLGFYHQHSASDRDDYIEVRYENIVPGKEFNFKKYPSSRVTDFGVGYDYESCGHYRPGAFSVNGEDTIVPLDPTAVIGQRRGLSPKDIDKINVMYKCPIKI